MQCVRLRISYNECYDFYQCIHPEIQNKTSSKMFFAQKFNIKLLHRCFFFMFRLPRRCFHETYIKGKSNPNNIFEIISSNAKCQGYPKQFITIPKMYYFLLSAILCHHCIVFGIVAFYPLWGLFTSN